jgi:tetratricopeptide (TPR) repeat protein
MNKKIFVLLSAIIVIAVAIGGWFVYQNSTPNQEFVDYRDPKLEPGQVQPFLDRINEAQKKIVELPKDKQNLAEHFQLLLTLGSEYYPIGEYKKAIDAYSEASRMFPNEPVPHYALATIAQARGDYQTALEYINRALELASVNPDYWKFKIALIKDGFKESPDSINALYLQALNNTKEHPDMITTYARFLSDVRGDLVGSVEYWRKAIEKNPDGRIVYEREIKAIQDRLK